MVFIAEMRDASVRVTGVAAPLAVTVRVEPSSDCTAPTTWVRGGPCWARAGEGAERGAGRDERDEHSPHVCGPSHAPPRVPYGR